MKKATFSLRPSVEVPSHWRHKETGSIMWKTGTLWNRIYPNGIVVDNTGIGMTPETNSEEFEPLYGELVITLSPEA